MKKVLMAIAMVLGFTATAHAANFAEKSYPASVGYEQALKDLFSQEMNKTGSPLNKFVTNLKKENPDYFVADKIELEDIFTIESGADCCQFYVSYLLVVRGGYKSNSFPMAYLKASIEAPMDDEGPFQAIIIEPAQVSVN